MAELKFSCPHCQQHIQADEGYAGLQIQCPSCRGSLIVPGTPAAPAPAASAPPPPVPPQAGARLATRQSAPSAPTGSVCPSCKAALPHGAVLCTSCGYNLVTRQRATVSRPAARPKAAYAGEAPWYMTPWPYIGLVALLVGVFYFLGKQNPPFYLGIAVVLGLYMLTTQLLVLIAAFRESVVTGFLTLCIPFYALYFVFKVNENDTLKLLYSFNVLIFIAAKVIGKTMK